MENYRRPSRPAVAHQRRQVQYGRTDVVQTQANDNFEPSSPVESDLDQIAAAPFVVDAVGETGANIELNLRIPSLRLPKVIRLKSVSRGLIRLLRGMRSRYTRFKSTRTGKLVNDVRVRSVFVVLMLVILADILLPVFQSQLTNKVYALGGAESLINPVSPTIAEKLKFDSTKGIYNFNQGYTPPTGKQLSSRGVQMIATAAQDPAQGVSVTDPLHSVSISLKPKYKLWAGKQDGNRVVYPLADGSGWAVYSMHTIGMKEDILLERSPANEMTYDYELGLGDSYAAKLRPDGSVGIYGNTLFAGSVSTGSEKDAALLEKARKNAAKNTLLFVIPAPTVDETGRRDTKVTSKYSLSGNILSVKVANLQQAHYPLTIDPSVYVESAQKFMRGNNETNVSFSVADDLFQKGSTTGARINAWSSTSNLYDTAWGQGVAAAGGYVYSVGGSVGTNKSTYYTAGSYSYTVPAGVTSLTVQSWGAGGGGGSNNNTGGSGGAGGGGGYAQGTITVTPGETLTITVGSGGAAATSNGLGGNGGGFSSVQRSSTYLIQAGAGGGGAGSRGPTGAGGAGGAGGGANGVNGSNGAVTATVGGGGGRGTASAGAAGSAGSGSVAGSVGAANAGGNGGSGAASCATAVTNTQGGNGGFGAGGRGGQNASTCAGGGGGGGGRFGGGGGGATNAATSGGGGGGGGSDLVTGTNTVETAGSGTSAGNSGDPNNNGAGAGGSGGSGGGSFGAAGAAGGVVLAYGSSSAGASNTVAWAKFDPTTNAIVSPDPGAGSCSGWCTNSVYNLPVSLTNMQLIAYNGFLYVLGGENSSGVQQNTVYIAKIGANGEPQLWHPTGGTPVYWYQDTNLPAARSRFGAVAYNNHLYILGGLTTGNAVLSSNTVQSANINPMGTLDAFSTTGMQALGTARYGLTAQQYNGVLYVIGGDASLGGTPVTTVEYSKLNADGSMNSWVATKSLGAGKVTIGGVNTAIWGGYIYIGGGCSAVNASGYCTTIASDIQLASINADGSLDQWNTILNLTNDRIGGTVLAWQNGLYRMGGCQAQDATTGACTSSIGTADYGVINQDGDASTVATSVASGVGDCSGANPTNCNLPSTTNVGQALNATAVVNGFLYVIGGCVDTSCGDMHEQTVYAAISSSGNLTKPTSCTSGSYSGSWCIENSNLVGSVFYSTGTACQGNATSCASGPGNIVRGTGTTWTAAMVGKYFVFSNGSKARITARTSNTQLTVDTSQQVSAAIGYSIYDGIGAAGVAIFNNRIYLVGGLDGTANKTAIYYTTVGTDGTISAWSNTPFATAGLTNANNGYTSVSYEYAYARANPSSAATNPGNLFIFGGCTASSAAGCTAYADSVVKCNIATAGSISGCSESGQQQIGTVTGATGAGLGIMAGTVYANYIYLIGGVGPGVTDLKTTRYAKFDNSNNVVAVSGSAWVESGVKMEVGRRRAAAFGYNGYIYVVGGYDGTGGGGILADIEFAKVNVSDGSIVAKAYDGSNNPIFNVSSVQIGERWGLSVPVSNSYAYVVGGCDTGASPTCGSLSPTVQTFQVYNNDSGTAANYAATGTCGVGSNGPCATNGSDRIGVAATVMNGYMYLAGGCSTATCTTLQNTTSYAPIDANGTVGAWAAGGTLPANRAWGKLVNAGGTLYYVGGQTGAATTTAVGTIYYTSGISSGNPTWNGTAAPGGIGNSGGGDQARTQFGATVWNNRIYVVGGYNAAGAVRGEVYVSPQLNSGGSIPATWSTSSTSLTVARAGVMVTAYANNLYAIGGNDGTNYLSDGQYSQINSSTGNAGNWTYTTNLPTSLSDGDAFAANGYMYILGGRSAATTCNSITLVSPISANTTIATGNNPTGIGEWYQTNVNYSGGRYGAAAVYNAGRAYIMGGGCNGSFVSAADRNYATAVLSQPQVAQYSIMIDADSDVTPSKWLFNGLDNAIGAAWQLKYQSMKDTTSLCLGAAMTTWGRTVNAGSITLGTPGTYTPLDGSGTNTSCARYYYMSVSIDASQTFGYPEDVSRGPTISDLTLQFTANPSKRLMHGRTFLGGVQQPDDTPF